MGPVPCGGHHSGDVCPTFWRWFARNIRCYQRTESMRILPLALALFVSLDTSPRAGQKKNTMGIQAPVALSGLGHFSVAFCSLAKSLTFSCLMEIPLVGKQVKVLTSKQNARKNGPENASWISIQRGNPSSTHVRVTFAPCSSEDLGRAAPCGMFGPSQSKEHSRNQREPGSKRTALKVHYHFDPFHPLSDLDP